MCKKDMKCKVAPHMEFCLITATPVRLCAVGGCPYAPRAELRGRDRASVAANPKIVTTRPFIRKTCWRLNCMIVFM